ncbi:conserved domain protein [Methylocaldum marinum]|uniref:Conserved domain protein n=2 Tax=Methylocaldum marinum TaxID=1432792 RepID=A0A250KRI2_9GAMM|nr:conserved domain protein [Methylocaldum marinum]
MKMSKTLFLGGLLLTGTLGMSSGAVAAENAAGVKEFMGKTVETAKQAQAAAAAGDKDGCLSAIKQTKQNYKEITGDAAGKPLQDAMKKVREAQGLCDAGKPAEAAPILGEATAAMEKVAAGIK